MRDELSAALDRAGQAYVAYREGRGGLRELYHRILEGLDDIEQERLD